MKKLRIALVAGETVGPELMAEAVKLLRCLQKYHGLDMELIPLCAGGEAVDKFGDPLPADQKEIAASCDAVLFGSIGASKYNGLPPQKNPARALLELRTVFGVTTNLRPVWLNRSQADFSPLRPEIIGKGFDILLARDVCGGMLSAREQKRGVCDHGKQASDLEYYNEDIIRATAHKAFLAAQKRSGRVSSLDKANVLASSVLWRDTVNSVAAQYPDVKLEHRYIDVAAMDVIREPGAFDVILTGNVFGDILADELAQLSGIAPMFGSAELAADGRGLYTLNQLHHPGEHLAGQNAVCPLGIFSAVSMLLLYTAHRQDLADLVDRAVQKVVGNGFATAELCREGNRILTTQQMGDAVCRIIINQEK